MDWTKRYPWIVETARNIRKSRFILQGKIGPDLFDAACRMGLEGIVSKHRERPYRAGRCDHWQKVKNPKHPAFSRVVDQF
jgi:ATP-dependent DNA ligase